MKSEIEKQIYRMLTSIYKIYKNGTDESILQGAETEDTDVEKGLVDTAREMEGRPSSTDIYPLPCVKETASGKPLYSTGNSPWCSRMT